jgi:hypothetical protein
MPPLTALGFYFAGFYKMSQCSTMASVSSRPERKLDSVTPRAEVDDDLDLTDQHRDLLLGQAVTRAHSG